VRLALMHCVHTHGVEVPRHARDGTCKVVKCAGSKLMMVGWKEEEEMEEMVRLVSCM
jgi:hypothetical protein